MKRFLAVLFCMGWVESAAACDDHHGVCEIEAWRAYPQGSYLTIEGSATCNSGYAVARLYDGESYIGNADGFIEGHAITTYARNIPMPESLVIKFSIEPR